MSESASSPEPRLASFDSPILMLVASTVGLLRIYLQTSGLSWRALRRVAMLGNGPNGYGDRFEVLTRTEGEDLAVEWWQVKKVRRSRS
jgi:hypothetical protein